MFKLVLEKAEETDQIANLDWIIEKAREFQKNIYFCFIDYAKPFDCVDHNKLWEILKELNTRPLDLPPEKFVCRGEELRWQRNRMGRTLSPPQIHQKNI